MGPLLGFGRLFGLSVVSHTIQLITSLYSCQSFRLLFACRPGNTDLVSIIIVDALPHCVRIVTNVIIVVKGHIKLVLVLDLFYLLAGVLGITAFSGHGARGT